MYCLICGKAVKRNYQLRIWEELGPIMEASRGKVVGTAAERIRTGRKKPGRHEIQRSAERPKKRQTGPREELRRMATAVG